MTTKNELAMKVIIDTKRLVILNDSDFTDINKKSPISKHSEVERLHLLNEQVKEAKAALDTFSPPKESFLFKYKKIFF